MASMLVPVIVGVGDVRNRSNAVADAIEPAKLMLDAIRLALEDSTAAKQLASGIDSISAVKSWTWPYADLPGQLASELGVDLKHKFASGHGGNQPAKLLDEAARRVAEGKARVAVITGGEALASLTACAKARKLPPPGWTVPASSVESVFSPTGADLGKNIGSAHSIGTPIQVYPLYENGFRAHRKQTLADNNRESARLYGEFAKIAHHHEYAWNYGRPAETEKLIGTVTKRNRMICFPYPLLMNAFNLVNLAAACVLTSTEHARELGIPESRWIYPLGGAGTQDSDYFWERPDFYSSPSINRSLDAALQVSGLTVENIDIFDFYSCFPIVPKLAAHHLGLPLTKTTKPLTLLGGLTSFGGAGNNYSMHAITEMVRQLRAGDRGQNGLVLANGGMLTYQHVVCLSTRPRCGREPAYPSANPLPDNLSSETGRPKVEARCEGEAVVETYTVEFKRDNTPLRAYIVGRLRNGGARFVANQGDESTLRQLVESNREPIGRGGWVRAGDGESQNVFTFEREAAL